MVANTTKPPYNTSWLLKEISPVVVSKPKAPIKPTITPANFNQRKLSLKKSSPTTTVKRGTNEFSMPVRELLMWVWASGNRKAGIPLPNKPATKTLHHWSFLIFMKFWTIIGERKRKEIRILKDATCSGLYDKSPFFIKIKELPQTNARKKSKTHWMDGLLRSNMNFLMKQQKYAFIWVRMIEKKSHKWIKFNVLYQKTLGTETL